MNILQRVALLCAAVFTFTPPDVRADGRGPDAAVGEGGRADARTRGLPRGFFIKASYLFRRSF